MKLLLDENLSRRLLPTLEPYYPDTSHVCLMGLERASDEQIWQFAKAEDYVIVSATTAENREENEKRAAEAKKENQRGLMVRGSRRA